MIDGFFFMEDLQIFGLLIYIYMDSQFLIHIISQMFFPYLKIASCFGLWSSLIPILLPGGVAPNLFAEPSW